MSFFDDLITNGTVGGVRAAIVGYAQAGGLIITDWLVGAVGQQILEAVIYTTYDVTKLFPAAVRGFASLATSTDPGDPDPFNPSNADLPPSPGYLSAFGQSTFGTTREGATFANGFFTLANNGTVARTFFPGTLIHTYTGGSPPSPPPTYVNAPDADIYVNANGSVTVGVGESLTYPITAQQIGTGSNAPPEVLSLTTTLVGCSGTNVAAVLGTDREDAEVYRERCRQAPNRVSVAGPAGIYQYLAAKNLDGTPLLNASGNPVNINRVQVTQASATGIVNAYFASPAGAASGEDVTAANANIESYAFAVPDAITYTGVAATEVTIAVAGTGKLKPRPGATTTAAKQAIVDALALAFESYAVGGLDQVDGAGFIYTVDIQADAAVSYLGLYDVLVTTPAVATTALAVGEVAVLDTTTGDWTVT